MNNCSSFAAAIMATAFLAGCAGSIAPEVRGPERGGKRHIGSGLEEKEFKEIEVELPSYPQETGLLEFKLRRNSDNRFYIDRESVAIGADRVVRYSAVIVSPSGVRNVSYEAIRCKTGETKVYAYGTDSGDWVPARSSQWRGIERSSVDIRFNLFKDYFCHSEAIAGRNAQDLIANLKGSPFNSTAGHN